MIDKMGSYVVLCIITRPPPLMLTLATLVPQMLRSMVPRHALRMPRTNLLVCRAPRHPDSSQEVRAEVGGVAPVPVLHRQKSRVLSAAARIPPPP